MHCRRLWGSPKGLRIILPGKALLCTSKFFQRIRLTPSLFFCKTDLVNLDEEMVKKSTPFFFLLILNHKAKKTANFEMCWVELSTDYVAIDSNSHNSLRSFLER